MTDTEPRTVDLDAIEARANAATEGPWEWTHGMDSRWEVFGPHGLEIRGSGYTDAAFIAAARTDVPALVVEVRRLRAENADSASYVRTLLAERRHADSEIDRLRADNERLHRALLDETYRPEGGEIVMREVREAQRERDEARAEVQRLRNEIIGWDHGAAILRADLERARAMERPTLAELQANYLAARQHTLSIDGLFWTDAAIEQADYIQGEAQELADAVNDLCAPSAVNATNPERAADELETATRHEIADVALSLVTLAKVLGWVVEDCIDEKTEKDRGRDAAALAAPVEQTEARVTLGAYCEHGKTGPHRISCDSICDAAAGGSCFTPWCRCRCHRLGNCSGPAAPVEQAGAETCGVRLVREYGPLGVPPGPPAVPHSCLLPAGHDGNHRSVVGFSWAGAER